MTLAETDQETDWVIDIWRTYSWMKSQAKLYMLTSIVFSRR